MVNKTSEVFFRWNVLKRFIKQHWLDYVMLLIASVVLVSFDQWTKSLVRMNLKVGEDWLPEYLSWLLPFARIRYWFNTGAAFGLFQGGSLVFTILAFFVGGFILYYYPFIPRQEKWLRLAVILQFSGAIGNLVDRLRFNGKVTDFISLGNFAIFNLADMSITIGTIILIIAVYYSEKAGKNKQMGEKPEAVS